MDIKKNRMGGCELTSTGFGICTSEGSCEQGNEPLGSIHVSNSLTI